jgi:hypothetical protein
MWDSSHRIKNGKNAKWFPGKEKSYREVEALFTGGLEIRVSEFRGAISSKIMG